MSLPESMLERAIRERREALDELARLRAELAEAREALGRIAKPIPEGIDVADWIEWAQTDAYAALDYRDAR